MDQQAAWTMDQQRLDDGSARCAPGQHRAARALARSAGGADAGAPDRAWTLRIAPWLLALPLIWHLLAGHVPQVVALALSLALLVGAAFVVEAGLAQAADYHARAIAKAPRLPRKLLGAAMVAAAVLVGARFGAATGPALALLLAAAGALGCGLTYGLDPRRDKGLAPELAARAGVRTEQVIEAITEAEAKIQDITAAAASLHSRDLTQRLERITVQARRVLQQIERDPGDLRRARRFLVTYLDGTRDVVRKYAAQQQDLVDTPLPENFRRVLETVERIFGEQEAILKQNDSLDLEVQIEVLQTQLEREGVT